MVSSNYYSNVSNYFKNINQEINKTTSEISSGIKTLDSKDYPISLNLEEEIRQYDFIDKNINNNKIYQQSLDTSINSMKKNIEKINELLIKSSNSTLNSSDMKNIKMEIKNNIENIKNELNTSVADIKIFNGVNTNSNVDLNDLNTKIENRKLLVGINNYKSIDINYQDLININGKNLITEIIPNIETALDNNDKNTLNSYIDTFTQVIDNFNLQHSKIGVIDNSISNYQNTNNIKSLNLKTFYKNITETNLTDSILKLNQLELQYSALSLTINKVSELSLVNFLK